MKKMRLPVMNPIEFKEWIKSSNAQGVSHIEKVLCGEAIEKQITDWKLFGLKAFEDYKDKPTFEKAVRLRNLGFKIQLKK